MTPLRLSNHQLNEIKAAAASLPIDLRPIFLERLALALQGKDLSNADGMVHRTARAVARELILNARWPAVEA